MKLQPLRYSIASWYDLPKCKSNISKDYRIYVEDIVDDDNLRGIVITVNHRKYGTLFQHILECSGKLLAYEGIRPHQFSLEEILTELSKFGFDVQFTPQLHLSESMLSYLGTLVNLNYDKLRVISIADRYNYHTDESQYTDYVVAFSADKLPKWLDNTYTPTKSEFTDSMLSGYSCNVSMSPEGKKLDWSWLDYIANIHDILDNNFIESK